MIKNIHSIRSLINDGISLIPVKGAWGGKKPYGEWGKSKTLSFEELLHQIEYYSNKSSSSLENNPCEHVAIRLGKHSGGVVCLDVDPKNKEGFGAVILNDFRNLYPEIYEKLRIDKSPSGGYHFYYRIEGYMASDSRGGILQGVSAFGDGEGIPSKQDLASRWSTDEELAEKPKLKTRNFLELKIEGQLSHCYPSTGYLRVKESGSLVSWREGDEFGNGRDSDFLLGILSKEEHDLLVSAGSLYNEVFKIEGSKIKGSVSEMYSENPFEHFNKSNEGARVLLSEGWEFAGIHGKFERYRKPGRKNKEIDATFNVETRIFKIWGVNAGIDARGYTPAGLVCFLKFGLDYKQLQLWLVANGYGIIKPSIEKNMVKRAVKTGAPLQGNISEEGKAEYKKEVDQVKEKYQYGIFWESVESGAGGTSSSRWKISREGIYKVGHELGFRSHKEKPCLIDGYIVRKVDERFFYDKLKKYIIYGVKGNNSFCAGTSEKFNDSVIVNSSSLDIDNSSVVDFSEATQVEEFSLDNIAAKISQEAVDNNVDIDLLDAYEAFLQNSGKFTITRLPVFDIELILRSTKKLSYKFYQNCYVKIDEENIEIVDYSEMNYLVWDSDIIQRNFKQICIEDSAKGIYHEFIQNAIGWSTYLQKCIGFSAHDYKDEESFFILLTEKNENPSEGGGSGKNMYCNLFKLITTVKTSAGSMLKKDNQLMQSWDYQRLFVLADLPKKFDFEFFKEIINGDGSVRKLYKDEFDVSVHDMPKFMGSTNFSFDISEPGLKRRIRAIEFTSYYTDRQGVRAATGKMFPTSDPKNSDWSEFDFISFDNIMINCIQEFLKGDCYIELPEMSNTGWIKQFEIKYTYLYTFFKEKIDKWVYIENVTISEFNSDYETFKRENNINKSLTIHTVNVALTEYCKHFNIPFAHKVMKDDGTWSDGIVWRGEKGSVRGRLFGNAALNLLGGVSEPKKELEDAPW